MGKSIFDKIQAKLELFRLEQRYTRRRNRRSTFVSNAIYVDGEYVYQTPNSTGSSTDSSTSRIDALHGDKAVLASVVQAPASLDNDDMTPEAVIPRADRKRLNRFSSMPGFGGGFNHKDMPRIEERRASLVG